MAAGNRAVGVNHTELRRVYRRLLRRDEGKAVVEEVAKGLDVGSVGE